ncbi:3'-5' exonuclease-like [Henckelia pumila]|uniref:3'-5' exonuclease-like n=1 Tax=Henckelia pumila TaxID=405737 RepID=UPI003C6E4113
MAASMFPINHSTYDVFFSGDCIHTTVTHDPTVVSQWISEVKSMYVYWPGQLIVGLDVEWRPSYTRGIQNPPATLQLCVGSRCLIFQLIHSPGIPTSLAGFLSDPNHTFVGVGINDDLEKLQETHGIGFHTYWVDLREPAANICGRKNLRNSGLKELARVVLGKEMEKPREVTMSGWDERWLSADQILYACIDAYVCFELGMALNGGHF